MNFWEFVLLGAAASVAIVTLVRMMRNRRDVLIEELTRAAEAERRHLRAEERKDGRRKMREKNRVSP